MSATLPAHTITTAEDQVVAAAAQDTNTAVDATDSHPTYRLLCLRSSQVSLTLTVEQIAQLSDQTGFTKAQLDQAVRLIQGCQVPRWYVWRGWPEDHQVSPTVARTPAFDAPDSTRARTDVMQENATPERASIKLNEEQKAAIKTATGREAEALELRVGWLEERIVPGRITDVPAEPKL